MKLAAIYNVWDGEELLKGSIQCIKDHIDLLIIVWQDVSNYNEKYDPLDGIIGAIITAPLINCKVHAYHPVMGSAMENERNKRNFGLEIAKSENCTHFLHLDVDEYYEDFGAAKQAYIDCGHKGSVCQLYTYFKSPTLRFETPDDYYVPFIHKLEPESQVGFRTVAYPFYVDPTRRVNDDDIVVLPNVFMHHFSYVRKDITRKAKNSTARDNIFRTSLLTDYHNPQVGAGSIVRDYHNKRLIEVENKFNIQL